MNRIFALAALLLVSATILLGCRSEDVIEDEIAAATEPSPALVRPSRTVAKPTVVVQSLSTPDEASREAQTTAGTTVANTVNLPLASNGSDASAIDQGETGDSSPSFTSTPQEGGPIVTPTLDAGPVEPPTTAAPSYPVYQGSPIDREDVGIQIHLHREDLPSLMTHLTTLDVGWVKVQVSWKIYQPEPGRLDEARFGELDRLIAAAAENDIKVLLGVAKAPEWSRPTTELDGPPSDYSHFQSFMEILASRYQGDVAAYELWNESNLQREWNGYPLSATDLVALISAGARGVQAADPEAFLISGAPAVTGINDGITAIDDRVFLQQMVAAGVANIVDAIGVHPYGWANPPDSSFSNPDPSVSSHNNHPSFFFRNTLDDYRSILDQTGNQDTPIWVTEFGWGTFDGLNASPPEEVAFMADVTELEQAEYTLRAFEMASQMPGVGPFFLWNLNFAPRLGSAYAESGFSVLRSDGSVRPAYQSMTTLTGTGG